MSEKPKVHIAIPNEFNINKYVAQWIGQVAGNRDYDEKYELSWNLRDLKPIDNNRNTIIKEALEYGFDYLLFMDSDNPPHKDPLPLVDLDLDIIACPTPVWNAKRFNIGGYPIFFNCMDRVEHMDGWVEHEPKSGLQEIDACGTGCVIIARRVLDHENLQAPFKRRWTEDGCATHGSDFEFCRRAKESGFRIWAHYDYPCHHFKDLDLLSIQTSMAHRDISNLRRNNINTKDYWDKEWTDRGERILPFYEMIADMVKGKRVLDFGCGRGDLLAMLGPDAEGMDLSEKAVSVCKSRGLKASVGTEPKEKYDAIVCTEVLEHLDDDIGMLNKFFESANQVIYSVPNNSLPPGLEPEHRRVYTVLDIKQHAPHVKKINVSGEYIVVLSEKE